MVKNILEFSLTFFDSNDMYSFSIHVVVDHRKEVKTFNYVTSYSLYIFVYSVCM